MIKVARLPWLVASLAFASGSCGSGGDPSAPSAVAVASVEVAPASIQMKVGDTQQFAASPRTAAGLLVSGKSATWVSSAPLVAIVDATGLVHAVASGTAVINATVDGKVGTATVTVTAVPVASVTVAPSAFSLAAGTSVALAATLADAQGVTLTGRSVTWTTNNAVVATVGITGIVTAVAQGSAVITATAEGKSGTALVTVTPNSAVTYAMSGRVIEAPAGTAVSGARVTASDANAFVVATTTTDAGGNWTLPGLAAGSVLGLDVSAAGFVGTTVDPVTVVAAVTVETVPLVRSSATSGGLGGFARDASTNQPITTGIAVELRSGMGATTGLAVQATTTAADGSYSFSGIAAGTYTLTMRGAGYAQSSRTVAVAGGVTTAGQDLTLSSSANANQWRIVLSWTAAARDLDLYLTLPGAGSTRQQIYFLQPGNCAAAPFACLDRDATTAPGPETITISQLGTGPYRVYVHNYNVPSSATDSTLRVSGAQVRLFHGAQQVATYQVPQQAGTLWTVFELDGATGNITAINTIAAGGPGDPVAAMRMSPLRASPGGKRDPGLRLP